MEIENQKLFKNEIRWLSTLLDVKICEKDLIIKQINNAEIKREYNKFFLSIKFEVSKTIEPLNISVRVPIEMRVYRETASPIQFLLHFSNGYVKELEIFCADSSEIDAKLNLGNANKIEIVVDNHIAQS